MRVDEMINHWRQIREGLLLVIGKFDDDTLAFTSFDGGWSAGQIMRHIAQEELGEVQMGLTGELSEWPAEFSEQAYPDVAAISELLAQIHDHTVDYMQSLDDQSLDEEIQTPWGQRTRRADTLWHVMDHEIHHRGELSLILGQLGREGLDA
jgi:uncharacterized damage-inducible protein DinB